MIGVHQVLYGFLVKIHAARNVQLKSMLSFNAAVMRRQRAIKDNMVMPVDDESSKSPVMKYALDTDETQVMVMCNPDQAANHVAEGDPSLEAAAPTLFPEVAATYVTRREQLELRAKKAAEESTDSKPKKGSKGKKATKGRKVATNKRKGARKACSKRGKLGKMRCIASKMRNHDDDDGGFVEGPEPSSGSKCSPPPPRKRKAVSVDAGARPVAVAAANPPAKGKGKGRGKGKGKRQASATSEPPAPKAKPSPKTKAAPKAKAEPSKRKRPSAEEKSFTFPSDPNPGGVYFELKKPVDNVDAASEEIISILTQCVERGHSPNVVQQFPLEAPVRLCPYWNKSHCGLKVRGREGGVLKWSQPHYFSAKSPCICSKVYCAVQMEPRID